jgi:hypothetical protein
MKISWKQIVAGVKMLWWVGSKVKTLVKDSQTYSLIVYDLNNRVYSVDNTYKTYNEAFDMIKRYCPQDAEFTFSNDDIVCSTTGRKFSIKLKI